MNFGKKKSKKTRDTLRGGRRPRYVVVVAVLLRSLSNVSRLAVGKPRAPMASRVVSNLARQLRELEKRESGTTVRYCSAEFGNLVTCGRPTSGHMQWHQCAAGLNVHAQLLCKT